MQNGQKNARQIFSEALDKQSMAERASYLDQACGTDEDLRQRVEALLLAHEEAGDFLGMPAPDQAMTLEASPLSEGPGTIIGHYKLLEKVGEGGMAVVYMAEQKRPVWRKVALKIIKLGMDTKQVIARFEAERQALALMDHPNIAKVFDAGTTNTGRPYFVMELVRGVSITEYCDKNKLKTRERLGLFIQVCSAVQHAHQKGIIHRDIKPTNVMVTLHEGKPLPMVIDFGIAKATSHRLTEKTLFTQYAQMIGTPEYMSPEQAAMSRLDVDTRTDIYSLGVLLYELLTGTLPFDVETLREAGYAEIQRIIREEEPDKPSTKLSTMGEALIDIAKQRQTNAESLPRLVRGDLDWIVMKALEKERARRYGTASEMAADIERHLSDEPVLAGPPSVAYRLQKFARRNRVGVLTGLLGAAALLAVAVVSALYAREAILHARDAAEHANEAEDARQNALQATQEISGLLAASYVDRAQALCEQGEVGRGMLWLADSLKVVPEDSKDLGQAVRTSLGAWHSQLHSLKAVMRYPHSINSVAFSPDGSRILAACLDGTARLCDSTTGQPIGKPLDHASKVWEVAISPNGRRMATRGQDGSVRLWDAVTLEPVGEPMQHKRRGEGGWAKGSLIVFSHDSSGLITGSIDGSVRSWDADAPLSLGKTFQHRRQGPPDVAAMVCCPDGLRIVRRTGRDTYQMFDADRDEPIGPPVANTQAAAAVAISPDGTRFATGDGGGLIRIWDAATGKLVLEPIVHGGVVSALAFSPDGSRIVSGGWTRMALLWDAATGEPIGAPMRQRDTVLALAFSPDGTRLATGSQGGVLRIWDLIQDKYIGKRVKHRDPILVAAYSPDGLRILTETKGAVQIRDAVTREPIGEPFIHPETLHSVLFAPDGSRLLTQTQGATGYLRLWDVASGKRIGEPFNRPTMSKAFSPDGSRILAGGTRDGIVRVWDAATLKCLGEFHHHKSFVGGVAFSPDGSQFLTGSFDGTTQLWDATKLAPLGKVLVHQSEVKAVAFSPDGSKFLTGFADGTVRLWDLATRKPIGTPLQYLRIVCGLAFSPDSSRLLACSIDRTARLWDTATLKPIGPPLAHNAWWPLVSFSPDGSEILAADHDGVVQLWQAPPGPLQGECERIICWAQVVTGMELDPTGGINVLDATAWQQRSRRLQALGGPPEGGRVKREEQ